MTDRDRLAGGLQALGVSLNDAQQQALLDYRDLLVKWNRAYNLTAVRDPGEMIQRHLLDSLSVPAPACPVFRWPSPGRICVSCCSTATARKPASCATPGGNWGFPTWRL